MIDDISGSLGAGMRGVWKKTDYPWPKPEYIIPTAVITHLAEVPELLHTWGGK
jgi:FMN phosphatase YigB (HAD superfamily)